MVTDQVDFVLGVDTHSDTHSLVVVEALTLRTAGQLTVSADGAGYRRALRVARRQAPGHRCWALEGTGSYGHGLARFLDEQGERVVEVERPRRDGPRGRVKSDLVDAERAARAVLAGTAGARPRLAAQTQQLRVLLVTREGAVVARSAALNQLRALLVACPAELRERLQRLSEARLLAACQCLQYLSDSEQSSYTLALSSLATRIGQLKAEATLLERELAAQVKTLAPELLARRGVGPISAAALLIAWSHPGRIRSEAAFARLTGTAPIPASSGKHTRHRLDRGGDRRANRALHTITLSLARDDPETKAYIARRTSEGKTRREAIRCLKRHLARNTYRLLERTVTTT